MIGIVLTLPGLSETSPALGATKRMMDGAVFADSMARVGVPTASENKGRGLKQDLAVSSQLTPKAAKQARSETLTPDSKEVSAEKLPAVTATAKSSTTGRLVHARETKLPLESAASDSTAKALELTQPAVKESLEAVTRGPAQPVLRASVIPEDQGSKLDLGVATGAEVVQASSRPLDLPAGAATEHPTAKQADDKPAEKPAAKFAGRSDSSVAQPPSALLDQSPPLLVVAAAQESVAPARVEASLPLEATFAPAAVSAVAPRSGDTRKASSVIEAEASGTGSITSPQMVSLTKASGKQTAATISEVSTTPDALPVTPVFVASEPLFLSPPLGASTLKPVAPLAVETQREDYPTSLTPPKATQITSKKNPMIPIQREVLPTASASVSGPPVVAGHTLHLAFADQGNTVEKASTPALQVIPVQPVTILSTADVHGTTKTAPVPVIAFPPPTIETSTAATTPVAAITHTTLVATPAVLEVGVAGGTQGWLKIRAEMGEGGTVQASLSTATSAGREMLHHDLPAMKAFLDNEQVPVTLHIAEAPVVTVTSVPSATGVVGPVVDLTALPFSQGVSGFSSEAGQQGAGAQDQASAKEGSLANQSTEQGRSVKDAEDPTWPGTTHLIPSRRDGGGWLNVMA